MEILFWKSFIYKNFNFEQFFYVIKSVLLKREDSLPTLVPNQMTKTFNKSNYLTDTSSPTIDSETGKLPTYNGTVQNDQDYAKMMLKNNQHFISDFAALSLGSAYNGVIPPPGAPISPPPNGAADHAFFGAGSGNMRMMAPPSMPPVQHPLYYYGRF